MSYKNSRLSSTDFFKPQRPKPPLFEALVIWISPQKLRFIAGFRRRQRLELATPSKFTEFTSTPRSLPSSPTTINTKNRMPRSPSPTGHHRRRRRRPEPPPHRHHLFFPA